MDIGFYLIPIAIILLVIKLALLIRIIILTKLNCNISVILKMFFLIPAIIGLMFVELVLYAIKLSSR